MAAGGFEFLVAMPFPGPVIGKCEEPLGRNQEP